METTIAIFSTALSIISIGIAIKTLLQNNKMIENDTRPYVVAYLSTLNSGVSGSKIYKLIIKNHGKSAAIISSVKEKQPILEEAIWTAKNTLKYSFSNLENITLAPNQNVVFYIDVEKGNKILNGMFLEKISFITIKYSSPTTRKKYEETFPIKLKMADKLPFPSLERKTILDQLIVLSRQFEEYLQKSLL